MMYSEKQYKEIQEELKKAKAQNKLLNEENKLLKKQNKQKDEVIQDLDKHDYRGQCQTLEMENKELKKKVETYEEKLKLARISLGKNSSNSCKPPSTDGYRRKVQNNRVKSGRKPGREKGHARSIATVSQNPDKTIHVPRVATCTCGCKTVNIGQVARDLVSIQVITNVTQYVGEKTQCLHCNKIYSPNFPDNVVSTINYDEDVKKTVVYLNSYCNVPNQKVVDFLGLLSDKKIEMSQGTVGNIMVQFSKKSKNTLEKMKAKILKEPVINEDETPIKVNGKIMSAIGVFTDKISLVDAFENRTLESFKEMGILDRYIGTVCHDHNNIHQSFPQSKQAECNFHILRYCKAEYEIRKRESITNFMNYLLLLRDTVDRYKSEGKTSFTENEYAEAREKYLELLEKWHQDFLKEYTEKKSKYYDSERCLLTRLKEYVDDHLRFLTDFRIDFTNNLAERGLRKIKSKLKISGGFRSLKHSKCYCDAISIIDTAKKQNMNIGETIKNIFHGKKKIFAF